MDSMHKDSAQLAREAEEQRQKLDQRLDEIQQRLSPGQLIDEALSYTKQGGGEFAGNLAQSITANPLPVALIGVGLAWLIAGGGVKAAAEQLQGVAHQPQPQPQPAYPRYPAYPYARVGGTEMQRTRHEQNETGEWYSHFADDLGKTYKAKSNEAGSRVGHFMDDAGKKFNGFIDESGNRVEQFRDEAGNMLSNGSEWASHAWHDVTDAVGSTIQSGLDTAANLGGQLTRHAGNLGGQVQNQAGQLGGQLQQQANQAGRMMSNTLYQQPLIVGALAFAAGAALGATLPHTTQEDELLGAASDKAKREAGKLAATAYEKGKEQVAEVYEDVSEKVGVIYEDAKSTLTDAVPRTH